METVVEVTNLTRTFGKKKALDDLSLSVPRGRVFGLVGENGAGKTTLIKLLLGLLRPTGGAVRVFGRDPITDPVGVLSGVGYLSEDRDLPNWMRVDELMWYTAAFYPAWDPKYAEELRQTFGLDPEMRIRNLSRGQRAQAGLLVALAYRPRLLLLDEPSSGLDPVVRRDILGAIIRTVADEGRTVVFSSHLLDEVERVADDVAMIHQGRLVLNGPIEEIKAAHRRVTLQFKTPRATPPDLPGKIAHEGSGVEWTITTTADRAAIQAAAASQNAEITETAIPSLEDLFVARVGGSRTAVRAEV